MNEAFGGRDPALTEIFVDRLRVRAQLGVYAHEKGRTQPLVVSVRAWAKLDVTSDDLSETVDYNAFAKAAQSLAHTCHHQLVETYIDALADAVMQDERILAVEVRAEKSEAIMDADGAGAVVFRRR
ncbi:MAG: dihydroneopterin aldolase [Pseudomonadota bacterium]